ncbi:uncharacterized protein LOC130669686 isoform X1 [Microplitis mediator]|uniref:uncharacterized protein LOC130669686 isoform X1 n=1 Tax=Microplitis mediator TaxID=375433 RepID=UPI0025530C5C|nr:uncharacterized protein LOC130669686 isoform X1 [Microplitis mediator]
MENRPKIEIVRVSSTERGNFRPLDGVQLRAAYSHVRIGTYCPEPEIEMTSCENKPPSHAKKFKKNLGPVSRLLRRRQGTCLATKSCDNIYNVNRNSSSLDWRMGQRPSDPLNPGRQSSSLDWRMGRRVNSDWQDTSRSAEHLLSRSPRFGGHRTPTAKSKLVSLLRRLSPRLPRPGSKNSLPSSPMVCPWIRVEYSTESVDDPRHAESQDSDVSYQQELQLNELRKRMLSASPSSSASQMPNNEIIISITSDENQNIQGNDIKLAEDPLDKSVHEDRTPEERRSRGGHSEVAGLEEDDRKDTTVTVTGLPGSGGGGGPGGRPNRRTRPLSLAVQPLHYQRLDSVENVNISSGVGSAGDTTAASAAAVKHPNMTSQESIGSCSLDVDRSASDRSEPTVDSVSERTLHSLNLSTNGDTTPAGGDSSETIKKHHQHTLDKTTEQIIPDNCDSIINGENETAADQLTAKKPSYLGLACSISGYSGITRYDSKLREGFRSRDSSPGSRLITRETSPAGFRSNENLGVPSHNYPTKSQSISPLAMDRQNGFTNGNKECKIETFVESRSTLNVFQGYSEVDRGISVHQNYPDISPIRSGNNGSVNKKITMTSTVINNKTNKSFSPNSSFASSPRGLNSTNLSNISSCGDDSFLNGSSIEIENQTINLSSSSEKSFIQQRVERLYGPGALAQGFFKRANQSQNSDSSFSNKSSLNNSRSSNKNDLSIDNANNEESLKNLPVLRHLRPEFRAQLPVVSPRRPTDGSEQIVKPMHRISVSSRKNDVTVVVKVPAATITSTAAAAGADTLSNNTTHIITTAQLLGANKNHENDSLKLSPSMTSITDQQPAAPEVVLPVLETSVSSTSLVELPKATQENNAVEVKDGHYFMKLLKAETDRLFKLAASAEAQLASGESLPEEAAGKLRSAAGKARLLATQKMQQFEGLCQKNITQIPGEVFPTTDEDLAGFWDMVMLQVVQVNDIFDHLEKLRNSQWQEVAVEKSAATRTQNGNNTKRRVVINQKPKSTVTSEANRKAREAREQARRQMLEDRRKSMKNQNQQSVEIFAPKT